MVLLLCAGGVIIYSEAKRASGKDTTMDADSEKFMRMICECKDPEKAALIAYKILLDFLKDPKGFGENTDTAQKRLQYLNSLPS